MCSRPVRAASPLRREAAQLVGSTMVLAANRYQLALIEGVVVRAVMDLQWAGAWTKPAQNAVTVARKNFFPNAAPTDVVVDPL